MRTDMITVAIEYSRHRAAGNFNGHDEVFFSLNSISLTRVLQEDGIVPFCRLEQNILHVLLPLLFDRGGKVEPEVSCSSARPDRPGPGRRH